jgi:hypothetical protein
MDSAEALLLARDLELEERTVVCFWTSAVEDSYR